MKSRKSTFCSIGAVLLVVLARTHAQAPPSTFQAEVNLIEVDTVVTDAQGNTVVGLTADDFELFDDGSPQRIAAFSYVDIPLAIPAEFHGVERPVSQDVRSNREPISGRIARTEVVFNTLGTESSVTTSFEMDERLATPVPVEMRFKRGSSRNEVRGVATYGRFRQFEVRTEETIQK